MNDKALAKATLAGSILIAAAIILGAYLISRAPRFEQTGDLTLIETRTGTIYQLKGEKQKGQPLYEVVPGPASGKSHIEPRFNNK